MTYIYWFILTLIIGFGGMLGILTFAGIMLIPAPNWMPVFTVPILDRATHGHVVTAATTWLAGSFGLFTFFLTRDQKENQIKQTQKIEDAKGRRERDLAELQRLEAEFAALTDDFAQPSSLARINAAIGLGEIAFKPDPRRLDDEGNIKEDPRELIRWTDERGEEQKTEWPSALRSHKTQTNFPYFQRAAHRLAAALHQWEDDAPRAQALRVLKEIGDWAKHVGTDEPLLHALCNAIAEENRTSWSFLIAQGAKYLKADGSVEDLLPLLGITKGKWLEIKASYDDGIAAIREEIVRMTSHYGTVSGLSPQTTSNQVSSGVGKEDAKQLFRLRSEGFLATREALRCSLRSLSAPPELPVSTLFELLSVDMNHADTAKMKATMSELMARRSLDLRDIRLFRAECQSMHLEGANCQGAHFETSRFIGTNFALANLSHAMFVGSDCRGVLFGGTNCQFAVFDSADCTSARFTKANCRAGHFSGAECASADFRWANFRHAVLTNANLSGTHLKGAKLWRSDQGQGRGEPTLYEHREWAEADFYNYEWDSFRKQELKTAQRDETLWNFLDERYPE